MSTSSIETPRLVPALARSKRGLLSILAFSLFVGLSGGISGCAIDPGSADSAEDTETSWAALSGKQTILSAKQSAALQKNLEAEIAATEAAIEALKAKIVVAEKTNQAALAEANALLAQVQQRRDELESTRNKATAGGVAAGILGFLVGGPIGAALGVAGAGAGAVAISADSKLSSLNVQLNVAQAKQHQAQADVNQYYARKAGLETRLDVLKTHETSIRGVLADSAKKAPASGTFAKWPTIPKRARKLELTKQLLSNLQQQETVLKEIADLAQALSPELVALVKDLEALRDEADEMVRSTQDDLWKIVAVVISEDPMAAATLWLEGAVAARAKEALAELHVPAVDYALWLVKVWDKGRSFAANPTEAVQQELVKKITASIDGAGAANWSSAAQSEVVKTFIQEIGR